MVGQDKVHLVDLAGDLQSDGVVHQVLDVVRRDGRLGPAKCLAIGI